MTAGLTDRRAVVTGATAGIGEAIARRFASEGWTVVLTGRSWERLYGARSRVLAAVPGAELELECADLSSVSEVRDLAERLATRAVPDVVVSNAAVIVDAAERTPEGLSRVVATNHLAPYLLLRSLADSLGRRRARFVVVSANPAVMGKMPVDLDDLQFDDERSLGRLRLGRAFAAYSRTKGMNAMFVEAFARRIAGSGITVNVVHPGTARGGNIIKDLDSKALRLARRLRIDRILPTPDTAADAPFWLATSPDVEGVSGAFFAGRSRVTAVPHLSDPTRCDRLWDESARLVDLPP